MPAARDPRVIIIKKMGTLFGNVQISRSDIWHWCVCIGSGHLWMECVVFCWLQTASARLK